MARTKTFRWRGVLFLETEGANHRQWEAVHRRVLYSVARCGSRWKAKARLFSPWGIELEAAAASATRAGALELAWTRLCNAGVKREARLAQRLNRARLARAALYLSDPGAGHCARGVKACHGSASR